MNRDNLKNNCKGVMRKIKSNWDIFSHDEITKILDLYTDREREILIKYKFRKDLIKNEN